MSGNYIRNLFQCHLLITKHTISRSKKQVTGHISHRWNCHILASLSQCIFGDQCIFGYPYTQNVKLLHVMLTIGKKTIWLNFVKILLSDRKALTSGELESEYSQSGKGILSLPHQSNNPSKLWASVSPRMSKCVMLPCVVA